MLEVDFKDHWGFLRWYEIRGRLTVTVHFSLAMFNLDVINLDRTHTRLRRMLKLDEIHILTSFGVVIVLNWKAVKRSADVVWISQSDINALLNLFNAQHFFETSWRILRHLQTSLDLLKTTFKTLPITFNKHHSRTEIFREGQNLLKIL